MSDLTDSKSYRLFVTNSRGRIDKVAETIDAASDEDAIAKSSVLVGEAKFELWLGNRRVITVDRGERDANRASD